MTETEAVDLLDKLENWMKTTNETLKTLVMKTDNMRIDISNLDIRLKKLEKNNGRLIISQ